MVFTLPIDSDGIHMYSPNFDRKICFTIQASTADFFFGCLFFWMVGGIWLSVGVPGCFLSEDSSTWNVLLFFVGNRDAEDWVLDGPHVAFLGWGYIVPEYFKWPGLGSGCIDDGFDDDDNDDDDDDDEIIRRYDWMMAMMDDCVKYVKDHPWTNYTSIRVSDPRPYIVDHLSIRWGSQTITNLRTSLIFL